MARQIDTNGVDFRKLAGKAKDLKLPGSMVLLKLHDFQMINGIVIPSSFRNADYEVISTGPGYYDDKGNRCKGCFAKLGDFVTVDVTAPAWPVEIEGDKYILIRDSDIICASIERLGGV